MEAELELTLCLSCSLWDDFAGVWPQDAAATERFEPARMTVLHHGAHDHPACDAEHGQG